MNIRIDRTRMAMQGRFYAYDALVPVTELGEGRRKQISYLQIRDGQEYVSMADATRPEELNEMPRGLARYNAFMDHCKACNKWLLLVAQSVYPELEGLTEWPTLYVELPELEASHDSKLIAA